MPPTIKHAPPVRIAVVLGAAVWSGGAASPTLMRRTRAAAALYRAGAVTRVIPTGGLGKHAPTEAEVMTEILIAEGVPRAAIESEPRATTTMESAAFVARMLAGRDGIAVTLVSDGYHLPRARLAFAAHGLDCATHAARRAHPRPSPLVAARFWLRELAALPVYALRIARLRRARPGHD